MSKTQKGAFLAMTLAVLMACNIPLGRQPSPVAMPSSPPPALLTAAAQTVVAAQHQSQPTVVPPAVLTAAAGTAVAVLTQNAPPAASAALPPTATPSPTLTLTPTITSTPTPSTPMVSVSVNTNCRTGPGDAYDRVGALLVGETAEVLARDPYGQFWYIPNPDRPGGKCWIWGQYATVTGDTSSLPVFTPPPTPTPAPAFVIKGVTAKDCCNDYFFIEISNTGETVWESYHIDVTDLDASLTAGAGDNLFSSRNGTCSPPRDVARLQPGDGAYIAFTHLGDTTHHMRFVVTLYAENGWHGQHLTRTVEYHP